MFKVQYKVKKVTVLENGEVKKKFVPICKKSLFGFGFWRECSEWEEIEKKIAEDKFLGQDSDSTLTHIRAFIDENDPPVPTNEYYH